MSKSGLSTVWQNKILQALGARELTTPAIGRAIDYPWYPKCSAVRVTLHWLARQGLVTRVRPGVWRQRAGVSFLTLPAHGTHEAAVLWLYKK